MKIAVFLPNWLGDLTMATPTLRALRRHFGRESRIVGMLRPYLADVLAGTDWIDEQWFFDPRAKDRRLHSWAVAKRMREERFDIAVLLTNSLRTAMVAWLGGAQERIGYVRYGRGLLLTRKLYPARVGRRLAGEPMVDTYLKLAYAAGCEVESPRLELATVDADEQSADAVFRRLGLSNDRPVAAMNCSGAYGASKLWPIEHFAELGRRIVDRLGFDLLVTCGPKERETARQIVALAEKKGTVPICAKHPPGRSGGHRPKVGRGLSPFFPAGRVVSLADQPMDFGTAKACIRRCRLMVSTDSGPRHVAAAFGLPLVTLYGPMLPVWSENPTQRAINLMLNLDCIGCHQRVCPLKHHRCMRDLTVDMVFDAVQQLL